MCQAPFQALGIQSAQASHCVSPHCHGVGRDKPDNTTQVNASWFPMTRARGHSGFLERLSQAGGEARGEFGLGT